MPVIDLAYPPAILLAALAIMLCGALLQATAGFGMGLMVVPLLVRLGFTLPNAVAVLLGAGLMQTLVGTYSVRAHLDPRLALRFGAPQWLAMPVGVWCMGQLTDGDPGWLRRIVGAAVIVLASLRLVIRPRIVERVHTAWAVLAGLSGGFIGGLLGMGGPPLVLFALAHGWSKDRFRAFLWLQFSLSAPLMAGLLWWRMGSDIVVHIALGLACAPVAWLGTRVGLAITTHWSTKRMGLVATLLLYAIGLSAFVSS